MMPFLGLRRDQRGIGILAIAVIGVIAFFLVAFVLVVLLKLLLPIAVAILGVYLLYKGRMMVGVILLAFAVVLWLVI